jgi:hypothetical protein
VLPAFFDTCSFHPDPANREFVMAEKMSPVRRHLLRIVRAAERLDAPMLSTTCLGIQRGDPAMSVRAACEAHPSSRERPAFVPIDASAEELVLATQQRRIIFERRSCKTGDENVRLRTFDPFSNRNLAEIVQRLGERHWYVFGAGFEHCLLAAVEGLRRLGRPVTVLADGCIHGGRSVPVTFLKSYSQILQTGAQWKTLSECGLDIADAA